jgi:hypothetical protein
MAIGFMIGQFLSIAKERVVAKEGSYDRMAYLFIGLTCLAGVASAFIIDGDNVDQQAEINRLRLEIRQLQSDIEDLKTKRTESW